MFKQLWTRISHYWYGVLTRKQLPSLHTTFRNVQKKNIMKTSTATPYDDNDDQQGAAWQQTAMKLNVHFRTCTPSFKTAMKPWFLKNNNSVRNEPILVVFGTQNSEET